MLKRINNYFHFYYCIGVATIISLLITIFIPYKDTKAISFASNTDIEFSFNEVLQVSLSSSGLTVNNLMPGSSKESNEITVTVNTNTVYGYNLNASVGQATNYNNRNLTLGNTNSKFTSIDYGADQATLTTDNTWGYTYRPSDTNVEWPNYSGLPLYSDTEHVANLLSTNQSADSESVQFKIAARAANDQTSGEYTNVINFYVVANLEPHAAPVSCETGYICYNTGVLTRVGGTMTSYLNDGPFQQIPSDATSAKLVASNFSREGYGFAGWNDKYDYTGNYYGPNEDITFTAGQYTDGNEGLSLYAVWVESDGSMQSNSDRARVCNSLTAAPTIGKATMSSVSALTDERDNQTYAIAKYPDGHCWMIENLRLEGKYTRSATQISQAQGYASDTGSGHGDFIGLAETDVYFDDDSSHLTNSLYYSGNDQTYLNDHMSIGTDGRAAYRFPRYSNYNTRWRSSSFPNTDNYQSIASNPIYSYGNYYSFPAAVASTQFDETDGDSFTTTSICPYGWRVPTSGEQISRPSSDFLTLTKLVMNGKTPDISGDTGRGEYGYTNLNDNGDPAHVAFRRFPYNYVYAGNYHDAYTSMRGQQASYWSSTVWHYFAYYMNIYGTNLAPSYGYLKTYGFPVRCLTN